jgi:hypothetical protein
MINTSLFNYGLGDHYASQADYDLAFHHYNLGAQQYRSTLDYDVVQAEILVDEIISTFTKQHIADLKKLTSNDSTKPVFIVGMMRSGSTLVEQMLCSHPDVLGLGEINTLAEVWNPGCPQDWADTYLNTIDDGHHSKIISKQLYNYLAIGVIHVLFPNAKIIHTKRDALETLFSCFKLKFKEKAEWSYSQEELVRYYNAYERLMHHWNDVCPEAFVTVYYEDLINTFEEMSKQLVEYIGLDWNPACLDFHLNSRKVETASVNQVNKPLYKSSLTTSHNYTKHLTTLIEGLHE